MIHSDGDLFEDDALVARLICWGIAAIIAAVLLLVPLSGWAQTAPDPGCVPANAVLKGTGTDYRVFETADVHGEVGWCPAAAPGFWHIVVHRWCLKSVCDKAPPNAFSLFLGAVDRIRTAADPIAQIDTEWATYGIPPATPLETWQKQDWVHQACQWLTSTQPGVTPRPPMPILLPKANPTDVDWIAPMTYCDPWAPGAKPLAPCAAQQVTWAATASCGASYAGAASGTVTPLANTIAGVTGAATATCTDGTLALSALTCTANAPPPAVYVVTPNGTSPTRQYFVALQQADGTWKRSTSPAGTIAVGSTCDCQAVNILEFNITRYCKVPAPTVTAVAACMVKK